MTGCGGATDLLREGKPPFDSLSLHHTDIPNDVEFIKFITDAEAPLN